MLLEALYDRGREARSGAEVALASDVLGGTGWDSDREEEGAAAWDALVQVEATLERRAHEVAAPMASQEWLWYLARARPIWEGQNHIPTTAPYLERLAEAASAFSIAQPRPWVVENDQMRLPIDEGVVDRIWDMAALAGALYDNQSSLRWAGKGARIVAAPGRMPKPRPSAELRRMVKRFDKRVAADDGTMLGRAGLQETVPVSPVGDETLCVVPLVGGRARNGIGLYDLRRIPLLTDDAVPPAYRWPRHLLDLLLVLWGGLLSPEFTGKLEAFGNVLETTGYRVLRRTTVTAELELAIMAIDATRLGGYLPDAIDLGSAEAVVERLLAQPPALWPPRAPVLRGGPDHSLMVDLRAATLELSHALARPRTDGEMANAWAGHFERSVQSGIDDTRWRPPPALASMRGRTLRLDQQAFTDLDAIGTAEGTLLLVSCKGRPFTDAWDRGEYRAVLGIASHVDRAVAEWDQKLARLRERPVGDNYDFSSFRRIVGVVAYPWVPWTPVRTNLREPTSGLRIASSAGEVIDWCRRSKR